MKSFFIISDLFKSKLFFLSTKQGHIETYRVPVIIDRLSDICRIAINQYVDHRSIKKLGLPVDLENFLFYENIKDQPFSKSL